jgi:hypothetical protein
MSEIRKLLAELRDVATMGRRDPTIGEFLQAHVHEAFTVAADKMAQMGYLSTDERIALSSAVGDMLETFRTAASQKCPASDKVILHWDATNKLMER